MNTFLTVALNSMQPALSDILEELDRRILSDPAMSVALFAELTAKQRELGLLHGDRPTCPFLRPHVLSRTQYSAVSEAASVIAGAFEKLVAHMLFDDTLVKKFGLTPAELELARIEPGYARLCVSSRLDSYLSESGFQFLEYNAETPAGVGDQMQLEKLLLDLSHNQDLLMAFRHWRPEPHRHLLQALLATYRESGGTEDYPQIAIVDWTGVDTESEFRVLKNYFEAEGHATRIADPHALSYHGDRLWVDEFRVDIVYKRVVIHEFIERLGARNPLVEAYSAGNVCMVNSFRAKVAHKKAGFAILSDPAFGHLFTPHEREVIQRHIPWTRFVSPGVTSFEGIERDLFELIRAERARFVLKPNDDYGGHGVFIGWESDKEQWDTAIRLATSRPYVVQERVTARRQSIPMFTDRVLAEEMFVDFNPFLFQNRVEGALIRLSSSALLNVTSGGGQTALLVLEESE